MTVYFQNNQWSVTDYGLEVLAPEPPYEIKASRLTELTERGGETYYDWPIHMAEKEWVDMDAFLEAFALALLHHTEEYTDNADVSLFGKSALKARQYSREAKQFVA